MADRSTGCHAGRQEGGVALPTAGHGLPRLTRDPTLQLHLQAIDQLDPDEQAVIHTLIEGALLCHQARRLAVS
jgi:hypothetical protein